MSEEPWNKTAENSVSKSRIESFEEIVLPHLNAALTLRGGLRVMNMTQRTSFKNRTCVLSSPFKAFNLAGMGAPGC
jgi:hypothetical protein